MPKTTQVKQKQGNLVEVREMLVKQRDEILSMYEHDLRVGQRNSDEGAEDLVDRANSAYNREFLLSLSGSERDVLKEIEEAIVRFDAGHYGVCEHCSKEITEQRLQAVQWARYCLDCQELSEQGMLYDN